MQTEDRRDSTRRGSGRGAGFGTIYRDGKKWRARFTAPDGSKPSKSFPGNAKTAARAWLSQQEAAISRGEWLSSAQRAALQAERDRAAAADAYTLGEWATAWLEQLEALGRAPKTVQTHRYRLSAHILPEFAATPLRSLTAGHVQRWHSALLDSRGAGVTRPVYMTLSAMLNAAVKAGHLTASPAQVEGGSRHRPVRDPELRQVATPAEVRALAAAMPAPLAIAVHFAAWCQLRQGEVLGLRRHDIDLDGGALQVRRQAQWVAGEDGPREERPKSEAGVRDLAIPAAMLPALSDHVQRYSQPGATGLVVPNPRDTSKHLHPNSFRAAWNAARAQVGMDWFVFHDLRHTGLTEFAKAGATNAELLHRGGHKSLEVALRYQHWTMQRDRALAAVLSELIDPGAQPQQQLRGVVDLGEARRPAAGSQ